MASNKNEPRVLVRYTQRQQPHTLLVLDEGESPSLFSYRALYTFSLHTSSFTIRSNIGPAREGPSAEVIVQSTWSLNPERLNP